jgi:hypothetical protein
MTPAQLLTDALGRVAEGVPDVLDGLTADELAHRPAPDANPVGWLVWHLARVYDDHVAGVSDLPQVYVEGGYAERFGLPFDDGDIGYGHTSEQVAAVRADADLLAEYAAAVHARMAPWIAGLDASDLDRVVDDRWDPPVTLGVRLVSVLGDALQHLGQAAYVRGLLGH